MARLTKAQEKKHDEALALLSLNRKLKDDEIEFVFRHYSPMATHRVAKGAIFFTPYEIASDFAVMARWQSGGRVVDYAAGIGGLTHHMLLSEYWDESPAKLATKHHICVEIEREFVEVGKKLLPQVEWVCGRWHVYRALHAVRAAQDGRAIVFDRDLMASLGTFAMGIANPPFGAIPSLAPARAWLKAKVPAHLATIELMVRMCEHGGFVILPRVDQEYQPETHRASGALRRLLDVFPGFHVSMCMDLDWEQYPKWQGASPDTVIADVSVNDMDDPVPLGFGDAKSEPMTGAPGTAVELPQQLARLDISE